MMQVVLWSSLDSLKFLIKLVTVLSSMAAQSSKANLILHIDHLLIKTNILL